MVMAAMAAAWESAQAQVQFIVVGKTQSFNQTSVAAPTAAANGFSFEASVDGSGMTATSPLTAVTVSGPSLTNQPLTPPNPGIGSSSWKYKVSGYASQAALDAVRPNGNYTMTLTGTPGGTTPLGNAGVSNAAWIYRVRTPWAAIASMSATPTGGCPPCAV